MLIDLAHSILPQLEHFRMGGYWIAFLAAFLETLVGVGLILPGSTIVLLLGAFSAGGHLDTGDLVWFAVMGAALGDNVNYHLGSKYGARWTKGGFWFIKADHIEKARRFLETHGAKSVFLGRFIPSVKEIVPFIAGSVNMNRRKFMLWNILGAIGWGCQWVFAGYLFAQSLNLAQLWLSRAGLFFTLIFIAGSFFYLIKWLVIRKGKPFFKLCASLFQSVKTAIENNAQVLAWTGRHPRLVAFTQNRLDRTRFSGLPLSISTLAFIYVAALFGGAVEDLLMSDPIVAADIRIANLFAEFRSTIWTTIFTWITLLGKFQVMVVFISVTLALLWLWRKRFCMLPFVVAVGGSQLFTFLGKLAFHRPRPQLAVYAESSFSFPSGHATIAVSFFGFVSYLLMGAIPSWKQKINILFAALFMVLAIGFSRIYLGEHFLSDVWAGYLVGAMWVIIAVSLCEWRRYHPKEAAAPPPVAGVRPFMTYALISLAVCFYVGFSIYYQPPAASAPVPQTTTVAKSTDIFTLDQTKCTETLLGRKQEPINFIFLARQDRQLIATLKQAGWKPVGKPTLSDLIQTVKAILLNSPHPSTPIAPTFWNTRIQDESYVQIPGSVGAVNTRHLRIWRTDGRLADGTRIYVGLTNAILGFKWGVIPTLNPDLDAERELLFQEFKGTHKIENQKKIRLVAACIGTNFIGDRFFTDGQAYILLIKDF